MPTSLQSSDLHLMSDIKDNNDDIEKFLNTNVNLYEGVCE